MAKTAAQRQREYRERKKAAGPDFLEKERQRQKHYYKPAGELSQRKLAKRNAAASVRNRLSRKRKRETVPDVNSQSEASTPQRMYVKLPSVQQSLSSKGKGLKKIRKRALSKAQRRISSLQEEVEKLEKRVRAKNKQVQRLQTKIGTPTKKQVEKDVVGLPTQQKRRLKKRLLLAGALMGEMKQAKDKTSRKARRPLHSVLSGKITKKYRLISSISRGTGLSRNSLHNTKGKSSSISKEKRDSVTKQYAEKVIAFMTREDNSRMQPGKADSKKIVGEKGREQVVVLTDYLANLHLKFQAENPESTLSLASFCRLRPQHVLLASFISRSACLCLKHQNMALKINSIRKYGVNICKNPDTLLKEPLDNDAIEEALPAEVPYKTWKKVMTLDGGKEISRMKIIESVVPKEDFMKLFLEDVAVFKEHVQRVHTQYNQLRQLKKDLPPHEFIVQMDFAENFSCRNIEEVQTAYWNQSAVTLHPTVLYFKEGEEIKHQSMVIVSDEMAHSAGTVEAFIDQIVLKVKQIDPQASRIHYWTDSPTSQYRNRFIFKTLAFHKATFNIMAQWNYFEAGHGKGPCDGLGGTTKRLADEAIRQGKVLIQDAHDFYRWAIQSSMGQKVFFDFVEKDSCEKKREEQKEWVIRPVKESMKLHAVVGLEEHGQILTAPTSCYCRRCIDGDYCEAWQRVSFNAKKKQPVIIANQAEPVAPAEPAEPAEPEEPEEPEEPVEEAPREQEDQQQEENQELEEEPSVTCDVGDFVAAVYEGQWFLGQVLDMDNREVEINFMEQAKQCFRWPRRKDVIWVNIVDIICKVQEPKPTAKSQRLFSITEDDKSMITTLFSTM